MTLMIIKIFRRHKQFELFLGLRVIHTGWKYDRSKYRLLGINKMKVDNKLEIWIITLFMMYYLQLYTIEVLMLPLSD